MKDSACVRGRGGLGGSGGTWKVVLGMCDMRRLGFAWRGSSVWAREGWMWAGTAWGKAGVPTRAVVTGASATVKVSADLLWAGCGGPWASRGDLGPLGWPPGIKKSAVSRGVSGGEAVVAQGTWAGLTCTSEGSGVELGVYLTPGCKPEPSCLFPEGDIVCQACTKIVFHIAGGNDVHVCHEVRAP